MQLPSSVAVTKLLLDWRNGNSEALNQLISLIYQDLHQIAQKQRRLHGMGNTLQTSALINEAYIKLVEIQDISWQNRAHFYGIIAKTIHRFLVDEYRKRIADKRGGKEAVQVSFSHIEDASPYEQPIDLLALNEALEKLEVISETRAQLAELKLFGGMTNGEIGEVIGMPEAVVGREWRITRSWLYAQLSNS